MLNKDSEKVIDDLGKSFENYNLYNGSVIVLREHKKPVEINEEVEKIRKEQKEEE